MFKICFLILVAFVTKSFANDKELLAKLEQGLQEYQKTRITPSYLTDTLQHFRIPHFFRNVDPSEPNYGYNRPLQASTTCSLCYIVANFLIDEKRAQIPDNVIGLEAIAFCTLLGIESGEICRGVIDRNLPIFSYLVEQNKDLKGQRICDVILQKSGCNSTTFEWTVEIPTGETVARKVPSNPEKTFNILQISDFHFDPLYTPGKQKDCGGPLCCQSDQEDGDATKGTACGYWSEYVSTDASEALVDESIRKSQELEFEWVYFTGDIVSHRVWATSVEGNTRDMKLIFEKMKTAFKGKPIYPILGNHEPTPLNEYAIGDGLNASLSTEWLYQLFVDEFSEWLTGTAKTDFMKGGYYTVVPKKGLRIIALNSNVAYTMNWWLVQNDVDPYGQLAWMAKTLKEAEDKGEIVHILSHIPSGKSDLMSTWSREYHKIIERFANTIAAQFNGHTHHDQFMVYHSSKNTSEAISIALNGASVIADKSNPSIRLLSIDNGNFDLIDTEEWTFNLTEANLKLKEQPNWYKLYSFREHYGVKSMAPSEFSELLPKMASQHDLLYDYHIYRYRKSDLAVQWGCDNDCKRNYLCEIAVSQVGDTTQCDLLTKIFNDHI